MTDKKDSLLTILYELGLLLGTLKEKRGHLGSSLTTKMKTLSILVYEENRTQRAQETCPSRARI
jgi:hypothetical protein